MPKKISGKELLRRRILERTERGWIPAYEEYSPEFLNAREEFRKKWDALKDEGERMGFLVWTDGYVGAELVVGDEPGFYNGRHYTETVEEFRKRVNRMVNAEWQSLQDDAMRRAGLR